MFSQILALVAALPMLSPPGLCICRWLEATRPAPTAAPNEASVPPPGGGGCCCSCPVSDETPPAGIALVPAEGHPPSGPPARQDRPRCPRCPDWELSALAKAEAPPLLDIPLLGPTSAVATIPPAPFPLLAADGPPLPALPPLYLLCCDLRC